MEAIEQRYIQDEIAASAYEYQRQVESGEKIIVGVNKFINPGKDAIPPFKIDDSIQQVQVQMLNELKARRNNEKVTACLEALTAAALSGANLMPVVIDAVENNCTLGEIAGALRTVFGEY